MLGIVEIITATTGLLGAVATLLGAVREWKAEKRKKLTPGKRIRKSPLKEHVTKLAA